MFFVGSAAFAAFCRVLPRRLLLSLSAVSLYRCIVYEFSSLSHHRRRSMNFPARHMVRYLGLLALGCQAFVIQPTSSSCLNPQQQLMFDNYQHKPPVTVRSFGDSLQDSVGFSAGCSSLLPSRSSSRRASTLRHGSATSMSLGEWVWCEKVQPITDLAM